MRSMALGGWSRVAALAALALGVGGCSQQSSAGQSGAANRPTYTPHVVRTARPAGDRPKPAPAASPTPAAPLAEPATPPAASPAPAAAPAGAADAGQLREAITRSLGSQNLQVTLDVVDSTMVQADGSPFMLEESFAGAFNGGSHHVTVRGTTYTAAGYPPDRGLELIEAGGRTYIHGPAPAAKAPEDRWYLAPDKLPIDIANLWRLQFMPMADAGYSFSGFAPLGAEELDGQQCGVFASDEQASGRAPEASGRAVLSSELRLWVCADGYLHKLVSDTSYGPAPIAPDPASKRTELRLFDFAATAPIAAPADAAPITP